MNTRSSLPVGFTAKSLLTLVLFTCMDASSFTTSLDRLRHERPGFVAAMSGFTHGTRRYLLVSTIFGLIVAVIDTLLLWALGVPAPVLWGLLAFITNYIPNIGFLIGLVPPAALAPTFIVSQNTDGANCSVRPPIKSVTLLQKDPPKAPGSFSPPRQ